MSKTFQPPKCPSCGTALTKVNEVTVTPYYFDPKTGTYWEDDEPEWEQLETKCPECGADLSEVFPEGVGNYTSSGWTSRTTDTPSSTGAV
jgi:endogenous inhibitor of DNA gyrase (YacG/DUF329 family)